MRRETMGFTVGQFRVLCASTALAVIALGLPARADGDARKPLSLPPAARATTSGSVSVDMSALDSVPNRRLLLPGVGAAPSTDGAVRLRPPPGVRPFVQAPIRLRPPPGVQIATPAPAPAKAPETKMAAVTPAPTTPAPAPAAPAPAAKTEPPKAAPPAAKAPATPVPAAKAPPPAAAPPAAPPKAAAAAPAPAATPPQKQTQVAVAAPPPAAPAPGQPRSLLTPPPSAAPAAAAPPTPAPTPAKTEEAKPAEPPKETNVAVATPPVRTPAQADTLTIAFKVGGADVPADAAAGLKALAARLAKDPTSRLQLIAYASDPEKSISRSRRLSLERAVNVRKVMLAAGIESTRIDIRALGEQSGSGAPDRVDVLTVKR